MPGSSEIEPARLPELVDSLPAIDLLRQVAERVPAYLVGGAVRDLLLGIEGADLDVAIEGDPAALADLPGFTFERDALFLTGRLERRDVKIDVAQTRDESYPRPGALPEVRPASIAPGMASRIALSTISMVRMDKVSATSATLIAARSGRPERSTGPMVNA